MKAPNDSRGYWSRVFKPIPDGRGTRQDIQGIRALAVMAVLLNHILGWPSGGFIGVDIFFVVSGYLITGILLREFENTGRISPVTFYKRRIKRILPASTLVIAATMVLASLTMLRSRALSVAADGVWALLFSANWRFATNGTNYFAQSNTSPLQHYWSLAVEEQFYFVWPWMLLGVLLLVTKGKKGRTRTTSTILISLILASSLLWASIQSSSNPMVAYFSTLTRAWELGVGALLATTAGLWERIPRALRSPLSWLGFCGVLCSLMLVTETSPFPFPWAVLPVVSSALLIIAGIGQEPRFMPLLTNPFSQFLGDISYSLYLWHFPVAILGAALLPRHLIVSAGLIGLSLLLASGSYYLFEGPLHRSPWLSGRKGTEAKEAWARWRAAFSTSTRFFLIFTLAGLMAASLSIGLLLRRGAGSEVEPGNVASLPQPPIGGPHTHQWQTGVQNASTAARWPALEPSLDEAARDISPAQSGGCLQPVAVTPTMCIFGSGSKRALLLGDSYAAAAQPMVQAAVHPQGYSLQVFAWYSCAISTAPLSWPSQPRFERDCASAHALLPDLVARIKPDLLIIMDSEISLAGVRKSGATWSNGRKAMLSALAPHAGLTVLVPANPAGKDINKCATVFSTPSSCAAPLSTDYVTKLVEDRRIAADLKIRFVDTRPLFAAGSVVPPFANGAPQRFDAGHLTATYARAAGPAFAELISPIP